MVKYKLFYILKHIIANGYILMFNRLIYIIREQIYALFIQKILLKNEFTIIKIVFESRAT